MKTLYPQQGDVLCGKRSSTPKTQIITNLYFQHGRPLPTISWSSKNLLCSFWLTFCLFHPLLQLPCVNAWCNVVKRVWQDLGLEDLGDGIPWAALCIWVDFIQSDHVVQGIPSNLQSNKMPWIQRCPRQSHNPQCATLSPSLASPHTNFEFEFVSSLPPSLPRFMSLSAIKGENVPSSFAHTHTHTPFQRECVCLWVRQLCWGW